MTGLIILVVCGIWLALCVSIARVISKQIHRAWLSGFVFLGIVIVGFPLPIMDEILAKPQLKQLCDENAEVYVAPDARGKTVYLEKLKYVAITDKWIPMHMRQRRYVDIDTKEVVVAYNKVSATGGKLMQFFPFMEGKGTIVISGRCSSYPSVSDQDLSSYGVVRVKRPN